VFMTEVVDFWPRRGRQGETKYETARLDVRAYFTQRPSLPRDTGLFHPWEVRNAHCGPLFVLLRIWVFVVRRTVLMAGIDVIGEGHINAGKAE
jgi:hypothetical protein